LYFKHHLTERAFDMPTFASLAQWLSYLEVAHPTAINLGLERVRTVKETLGIHFDCPVITVGGTNGKGSTCAMLESILLQAGFRVGCHTSPHLLSFNERARLNGQAMCDEALLPHFEAVEQARRHLSPDQPYQPQLVSLTYFEFTTLAILHAFASNTLDVVILEVGLGGRLDAMNVIDTDCAIITSIDIDHTAYLGDTREAIAREKAGIFRPGKPAICADPLPPSTLLEAAHEVGADVWQVGRDFRYAVQKNHERQQWDYVGRNRTYPALAYPALRGANQLLNASAALAAMESLHDKLPICARDIRLGLANVSLPGRFQVLPGRPTVILDVAHNPHAAAVLQHNLGNMGYFPYTYAVFGAMKDKDLVEIVKRMKGVIDHWCLTDLPIARAASLATLQAALHRAGVEIPDAADTTKSINSFSTPAQAYKNARERASQDDRILVFGSFYTVAGVMPCIHLNQR
jgi:dihydrofolate synthase/folylpolyglutamate synthase